MDFDSYLNSPIECQDEMLKLFSKDSAITIFDIGACEGEDAIKYSNFFPNAKVYAFEPLPKNIEKAANNFIKYGKTDIILIPIALSNQTGETKFYVSSGAPKGHEDNLEWDFGNKSSSLLPPDMVKEEFEWLKFEDEITVQTDTLSNFCNINNIVNIDFIHLDVQGAELLVLNGANDYLSNIKAIWLEVENVRLYKDQPLKKDIELYMKTGGFIKIVDTVDRISGDQLYVKRELLNKQNPVKRIAKRLHDVLKRQLPYFNYFQRPSYSQTGEDVIIDFIFSQLHITKPSYIDIGAHHPFYLSNTALFYSKGCSGINIEPDPELFKQFTKYRKKDININCGIGADSGELMLNIMNVPAVNTFSAKEAQRLEKEHGFTITKQIKVPVLPVDAVINKYANGIFPDFLSLDVEGLDMEIIRSINFKQSAPTVICTETISYSDTGQGVKQTEIIDYLQKQGYMVYADTNINTIFVLEEKWKRS